MGMGLNFIKLEIGLIGFITWYLSIFSKNYFDLIGSIIGATIMAGVIVFHFYLKSRLKKMRLFKRLGELN